MLAKSTIFHTQHKEDSGRRVSEEMHDTIMCDATYAD